MRDYLTVSNLKQAAFLGGIVSIMAVPRIMEAGISTCWLLLAVFPAMTLVAGAATAWGTKAGMVGLFPERKRMIRGMIVGAVVGLVVAPFLFFFDIEFRETLVSAGHTRHLELSFPVTFSGCLALVLWSAGFETLFFRAGTLSFFARVTGREWLAVAGAVVVRAYVCTATMDQSVMASMTMIKMLGIGIVSVISCTLYARSGLLPAMVFAAVLDSRHFVAVLLSR